MYLELQVVFVGPQLLAVRGPDQFRRDPHRVATLADAADHHIPDAELLADFAGVHRSSLERHVECREMTESQRLRASRRMMSSVRP